MAKVTSVDISQLLLTTDNGNEHELCDHEYWHISPTRVNWVPADGFVSPFSFGMLRHNARLSHGLVLAQEDLLEGITPKSMKSGSNLGAENLLEEIRKESYPNLPSRLRCHYLNYDKGLAEARKNLWGWHNRSIERCYIIRNSGFFHHADVAIYEQLVDKPNDYSLAEMYWQTFNPTTIEEFSRLEVLANSSLYFPDWNTFQEVNLESLTLWNNYYHKNQ